MIKWPTNMFKKRIKRDSRRRFTIAQRKCIWYAQEGKCNKCGDPLDQRTVNYDHIKRWADGGETEVDNGAALCPGCHAMKTFTESPSLNNTK